jgi:hypothetical protein
VGAQNKFLIRGRALRSSAMVKARNLATKSSINLSRIAFIGVIALAFVPPESLKPGHIAGTRLAANIEIVRTRPLSARAEAPSPTSIPSQLPPRQDAKKDSEDGQAQKAESTAKPEPSPAEEATQPAKPAEPPAPVPPSAQPAPPWTDTEIATARAQCDRLLDKVTFVADVLEPTREGVCGAPAPRLLKSLGVSKVRIDPSPSLNCPMIAALNTWLSDNLQPAAQKGFGSLVVRILAEGAYSCRNRYGLASAPISEHAFMNAIDISGFVLENGKVIKVGKSWAAQSHALQGSLTAKPTPPSRNLKILAVAEAKLGASDLAKQVAVKPKPSAPWAAEKEKAAREAESVFLHRVHDDACEIFGTVLGPDANAAHHDHFHLDMKARKYRSICE